MAKETGISWTDATWNPWFGCRKVSQGCKNCYMFRDQKRYGRDPNYVQMSKTTFYNPLGWKEPRKVFTCSWSDFFIDDINVNGSRPSAWDTIRRTPQLTYQILTKRPQNIARMLPLDWGTGYPNVWLGVSVEDQKAADERIPILLDTSAAIRFLSCEPLLEAVNLSDYFDEGYESNGPQGWVNTNGIDWVIIGGESGPDYREMKDEWARDLVEQCKAAGVAVWFKQHSGPRAGLLPLLDGQQYHEWPQVAAGEVVK